MISASEFLIVLIFSQAYAQQEQRSFIITGTSETGTETTVDVWCSSALQPSGGYRDIGIMASTQVATEPLATASTQIATESLATAEKAPTKSVTFASNTTSSKTNPSPSRLQPSYEQFKSIIRNHSVTVILVCSLLSMWLGAYIGRVSNRPHVSYPANAENAIYTDYISGSGAFGKCDHPFIRNFADAFLSGYLEVSGICFNLDLGILCSSSESCHGVYPLGTGFCESGRRRVATVDRYLAIRIPP